MKFLWASFGVLLLFGLSPSGLVSADEFDYGPACQWIRLEGEISAPDEAMAHGPLLLTVYYRFDEQKNPAPLLVNYPLKPGPFHFVLAGFDEKIAGTIFVSPMFFFAHEVEFTYFARSRGGEWASAQGSQRYSPERIKRKGQVLCQTRLNLATLNLTRH